MVRRVQRTSSEELRHIILGPTKGKYFRPTESFDEVYPGILIGDASTALSTCLLKELGVTHVVNAAYGKNDRYNYGYVNTSFSNYKQAGIKFIGVSAMDTPSYYLRSHFKQVADFIEDALRSGGKVLVHCLAGISRSATLVAAFLMQKKGMSVEEAIKTLRSRRNIFPNDGFLTQLSDFDYEIKRRTSAKESSESVPTVESGTVIVPPEDNSMVINGYYSNRQVSRGGYPLTSNFYDYATKSRSRARSEDRATRNYYNYTRARSASPAPMRVVVHEETTNHVSPSLYRSRATSVMPRTSYLERTHSSVPVLTRYESGASPSSSVFYHTRATREPLVFTGRLHSRPITTTYLKTKYPAVVGDELRSSANGVTSKRELLSSSAPYESYWYTSPIGSRTYSTHLRSDGPTSRLSYGVSSNIRYPARYPFTYRHSHSTSTNA